MARGVIEGCCYGLALGGARPRLTAVLVQETGPWLSLVSVHSGFM